MSSEHSINYTLPSYRILQMINRGETARGGLLQVVLTPTSPHSRWQWSIVVISCWQFVFISGRESLSGMSGLSMVVGKTLTFCVFCEKETEVGGENFKFPCRHRILKNPSRNRQCNSFQVERESQLLVWETSKSQWMSKDGVGRIWLPGSWERSVGWPRDHGENQGHSRHHTRQGAHDRKDNVDHSSDSTLVNHVLQKGVAHGTRKYTD
jgi:hypothetical protein